MSTELPKIVEELNALESQLLDKIIELITKHRDVADSYYKISDDSHYRVEWESDTSYGAARILWSTNEDNLDEILEEEQGFRFVEGETTEQKKRRITQLIEELEDVDVRDADELSP